MSDTDVATLRHLNTEIEAASERLHQLGVERRRIVTRMRQRMTVAQIGTATGLSAARIYQLLSDAPS